MRKCRFIRLAFQIFEEVSVSNPLVVPDCRFTSQAARVGEKETRNIIYDFVDGNSSSKTLPALLCKCHHLVENDPLVMTGCSRGNK